MQSGRLVLHTREGKKKEAPRSFAWGPTAFIPHELPGQCRLSGNHNCFLNSCWLNIAFYQVIADAVYEVVKFAQLGGRERTLCVCVWRPTVWSSPPLAAPPILMCCTSPWGLIAHWLTFCVLLQLFPKVIFVTKEGLCMYMYVMNQNNKAKNSQTCHLSMSWF